MFSYNLEIKVSGCNQSVSEWYPAYRDTRLELHKKNTILSTQTRFKCFVVAQAFERLLPRQQVISNTCGTCH